MSQVEMGSRVRDSIARVLNGRSHRSVAEDVGMTPDAFSRAVNGSRAFSSLELARIAELLHADIHWLITGNPDPQRAIFAARHDFDHESNQHVLPGREDDATVLDAVTLAYRQARDWVGSSGQDLPGTAAEVRAALGRSFVGSFAERVEECFGLDVVRVQGLSTDYSFVIGERPVVVLKSEPNWFRSNWSLAHEIGHLALGHHEVNEVHSNHAAEQQANAFAAELLLPESELRAVNWQEIDSEQLALAVWDYGVSTQALRTRLQSLSLSLPTETLELLSLTTQRLLRAHPSVTKVQPSAGGSFQQAFSTPADPITTRMKESAERRFPGALIRAHLDGIAAGRINKSTLAWILEVSPEDLDVDEPETKPAAPVSDFIAAMGL